VELDFLGGRAKLAAGNDPAPDVYSIVHFQAGE
jgi:hypothetical protein